MAGELSCLASAIEAGNEPLPLYISKLIQYAPESFVDKRAGEIAVNVRAMRAAGEPVTFPAMGEKHLPLLSFIGAELAKAAMPLDDAEYYAKQCWQDYQARRTISILAEGHGSVMAAPDKFETVVANVVASLDSITGDKTSGLTIRTPDEIIAMVFDDQDIIVGDRIIAEGQSCVFVAAGGLGKSRISLQIPACVATGRKFLNFTTGKENSKWLFLQTENSNRRLQSDLRPLKSWLGEDWPKFATRVKFHTVENDTDAFVNLDSPDAVANIQAAIKLHAPDIIVVDPLNDFAIGDLNKDADMKMTLQTLSRICRKGNPKRAIVVLHHALTGKFGAARATGFDRASFGRNSKTLHAWTRAQINLAPVDPDSNERLIVACGKCSNGREFPAFAVRLNLNSMIYEVDPTVDVSQWEKDVTGSKDSAPLINPDRVRELCTTAGSTKAALAKAIMDDCGCYRGSAYRYIIRAEQAKKITFNKSNEIYFRK
jgi:AAA domain